jgi:hypothetical protein
MKDEEHVNHDTYFQEKLDSLNVSMAHIAKKYL